MPFLTILHELLLQHHATWRDMQYIVAHFISIAKVFSFVQSVFQTMIKNVPYKELYKRKT